MQSSLDPHLDDLFAADRFADVIILATEHINKQGSSSDAVIIQALVFRAIARSFFIPSSSSSSSSSSVPASSTTKPNQQQQPNDDANDAARASALLESTSDMVPRRSVYHALVLLLQTHQLCTSAKRWYSRALAMYCDSLQEHCAAEETSTNNNNNTNMMTAAIINDVIGKPRAAADMLRTQAWPLAAKAVAFFSEHYAEIRGSCKSARSGSVEQKLLGRAFDTVCSADMGGTLLTHLAPEWASLLPREMLQQDLAASNSSPSRSTAVSALPENGKVVYIDPSTLTVKSKHKIAAGSFVFREVLLAGSTTTTASNRNLPVQWPRGDFEAFYNAIHDLSGGGGGAEGEANVAAIARQLRVLALAEHREAAHGGFGQLSAIREVFAAEQYGDGDDVSGSNSNNNNNVEQVVAEIQSLQAEALAQHLVAGIAVPVLAHSISSSTISSSSSSSSSSSCSATAASSARNCDPEIRFSPLRAEQRALAFPVDQLGTFSGIVFKPSSDKQTNKKKHRSERGDEVEEDGDDDKKNGNKYNKYPAPTPRENLQNLMKQLTKQFLSRNVEEEDEEEQSNNDDHAASTPRVVFPLLSWVPHHCVPNAVYLVASNDDKKPNADFTDHKNSLQVFVIALRDIDADEEVTISRAGGFFTPPSLRAAYCGGINFGSTTAATAAAAAASPPSSNNTVASSSNQYGFCREFCCGPFGDSLEFIICPHCSIGCVSVEAPPRAYRMLGHGAAHRCCGMCNRLLLPLPQLRADAVKHICIAQQHIKQGRKMSNNNNNNSGNNESFKALRILHSVMKGLPILVPTHHIRMKLAIDIVMTIADSGGDNHDGNCNNNNNSSHNVAAMFTLEDMERAKDACAALADAAEKCGVPTLAPVRADLWMAEVNILGTGAKLSHSKEGGGSAATASFSLPPYTVGYFREKCPANFALARDRCAWAFEVYSVLVSAVETARGSRANVNADELLSRFLSSYAGELAACGVKSVPQLAEMMRVS